MPTETQQEYSSFAGLTLTIEPVKGQLVDVTQQAALREAFPGKHVVVCHENLAWIGNTSSPTSMDGYYYRLIPIGSNQFTLAKE